jgi:hypothetical protein
MVFWDRACTDIELQEGAQDAAIAAQAAADAAQAAVEVVEAAVVTVAADAAAAQASADAAQAAVDAIVVPPFGSRVVSSNTVLTQDDYAILADASGGAITLTLPSADLALGNIIVTKTDATANAVDIEPDAGENLNGAGTPISIITQGGQRTFVAEAPADWYG